MAQNPANYIRDQIRDIRRSGTVDKRLQQLYTQSHQKTEKYCFAEFCGPIIGQW